MVELAEQYKAPESSQGIEHASRNVRLWHCGKQRLFAMDMTLQLPQIKSVYPRLIPGRCSRLEGNMCIYIYIYMYKCVYIYIYVGHEFMALGH